MSSFASLAGKTTTFFLKEELDADDCILRSTVLSLHAQVPGVADDVLGAQIPISKLFSFVIIRAEINKMYDLFHLFFLPRT